MDNQKQQIVDSLKKANNVLVTVSNNPSVDQLAACIGLSLALNKLDKHATAVFSGEVPSTLEFLQPENTIEKNTDSLRDFIISLDKSKADKLRYKVEEEVVRIFITPYRTSITDKDLDFSQGDFNVDVVVALGVQQQADIDEAVTAHGRILHDAIVVGINDTEGGELGSINWIDTNTSSLSEMTSSLVNQLGDNVLDEQISTALLTGIVAQTDRFSNQKTSANTMQISATLMAAGANQQLVASKLQEPVAESAADEPAPQAEDGDQPQDQADDQAPAEDKPNDGTLEIDHKHDESEGSPTDEPKPEEDADQAEPSAEEASDDSIEQAEPVIDEPEAEQQPGKPVDDQTDQPADIQADNVDQPTDQPVLERYENERTAVGPRDDVPAFNSSMAPPTENFANSIDLPPVEPLKSADNSDYTQQTLTEIEQDVRSPHLEPIDKSDQLPPVADPAPVSTADDQPEDSKPASDEPVTTDGPADADELDLSDLQRPTGLDESPSPAADLDAARNAVAEAMSAQPDAAPAPIAALNAQPLGEELHPTTPDTPPSPPQAMVEPLPSPQPDLVEATEQAMVMPVPLPPPPTVPTDDQLQPQGASSAPPVPPPIMPLPPYSQS